MDKDFGARLRDWRRVNMVKQTVLAADLGVTQAAISRWENGLDRPSKQSLARLRGIMGRSDGELAVEKLYVEQLPYAKALFDLDGMRLVSVSRGFSQIWPDFAVFIDHYLVDQMVGETAELMHDPGFRSAIKSDQFLFASGVSDRHLDVQADTAMRHRWYARNRRFGMRNYVDISFEVCDPSAATGIESTLYRDDLTI